MNKPFLMFFMLVLGTACAPLRTVTEVERELQDVKSPSPNQIEPKAAPLYFQAEQLYQNKKYDDAALSFAAVRKKFPRGRAAEMSTYRLGTIAYYQGKYPNAIKEFAQFLDQHPNSNLGFDVRYNLAASEYQYGSYPRAFELLSQWSPVQVNSQGSVRARMIYDLKARAAERSDLHAEAVLAYVSQYDLVNQEDQRSLLVNRMDYHLGKIKSRTELDSLLSNITLPELRARVIAYIRGGESSASEAGGEDPFEGVGDLSEEVPFDLVEGSKGNPRKIGVVLPLSGRWSAIGRRALNGILLASERFTLKGNDPFEILIRDSAGSPMTAAQSVDELFFKQNVAAILGPISWKAAMAVAKRSQQLGVVNFSLSLKEGISRRGSYLFQNAITARTQLDHLVQHAIKEKGFSRFAILSPQDSYGQEMSNQFWDLVEQYGGKVVAYETYDAKETDFQQPIRALAGLTEVKQRWLEWNKLNEFLELQKSQGIKNPKGNLPALVDFDAMFIPDHPKNVGQIAPSLAYLEVTGFPLLGTIEWNTDQLYRRGGKYVEGALFPAGLNPASRNPRQRGFMQAYVTAFGAQPDLVSAQAYEAALILLSSLERTQSEDRNAVVQQLMKFSRSESPLGILEGFGTDRILQRSMGIYALSPGGNIVERE